MTIKMPQKNEIDILKAIETIRNSFMEKLQREYPYLTEIFKTILQVILNFVRYSFLTPMLVMWIAMFGFAFSFILPITLPLIGIEPVTEHIPVSKSISSHIPSSSSSGNSMSLLTIYFLCSLGLMVIGDIIKYILKFFKFDFKFRFITKMKVLLIFITTCYTLVFGFFFGEGEEIIGSVIVTIGLYILTIGTTLQFVAVNKITNKIQDLLLKTETPEQI